jgi:hypothetical protein
MTADLRELAGDTFAQTQYDLEKEEMRRRVGQLLREREPSSGDRVVCYMLRGDVAEDVQFANVARTIECTVFDEKFGNNPEEMNQGYGAYESQSIFFLSIDTETLEPVGALRVIENGPNGLKTINDIPNHPGVQVEPVDENYEAEVYEHYGISDPNTCWDIGTVAVPREFRDQGLSPLLYRAMYVASQKSGIKHFFSVIDRQAFSQMRLFGLPFVSLLKTKEGEYMGSLKSQPLYGDAPTFEGAVREKEEKMGDRLVGHEIAKSAFRLLGGSDAGRTDSPLQF